LVIFSGLEENGKVGKCIISQQRWVIAYSFVIPFSTRANRVESTPSADSNILCSISKCGANSRLRKGLCRIGLADCDRMQKGMGWAGRTSDHNKRKQNLQDFKSLLTFRQGLHDNFLLFRFVKFQLAVTTVVQTPNNIQTHLIYCTKL
jgi:hypothetical protein